MTKRRIRKKSLSVSIHCVNLAAKTQTNNNYKKAHRVKHKRHARFCMQFLLIIMFFVVVVVFFFNVGTQTSIVPHEGIDGTRWHPLNTQLTRGSGGGSFLACKDF